MTLDTYTAIDAAIKGLRALMVADLPSDTGRLACPVCQRSLETDDGPALSPIRWTYDDYEKLRLMTVAQLVALNHKVTQTRTLTFEQAIRDCWLSPTWDRTQHTVMLWVDGILTGIEPDGYTHT